MRAPGGRGRRVRACLLGGVAALALGGSLAAAGTATTVPSQLLLGPVLPSGERSWVALGRIEAARRICRALRVVALVDTERAEILDLALTSAPRGVWALEAPESTAGSSYVVRAPRELLRITTASGGTRRVRCGSSKIAVAPPG